MENNSEERMEFSAKVRIYLKKSIWSIIGIVVGAIGGYIYYRMVGCSTGGCPITSNPWLTMVWGAVLGYLLGSMFTKKEKTN